MRYLIQLTFIDCLLYARHSFENYIKQQQGRILPLWKEYSSGSFIDLCIELTFIQGVPYISRMLFLFLWCLLRKHRIDKETSDIVTC